MRMIKFSVVLPVLSLVSANMDLGERREGELVQLVARQRSSGVLGPLVGDEDDEESSSTTTSAVSTTTAAPPTRPPTTTTSEDDAPPTTSPTTTVQQPPTSSTSRTSSSSSITDSEQSVSSSSESSTSSTSSFSSLSVEPSSSSTSMSVEPSTSLSVDAGGETVVVTVMQSVVTESVSRSSVPAAASSTAAAKEDDDGLAIPLGAVIGISIGAGLVVLLLIGLAIWRMKRRTTDEDDAIRWPELNRHGDSDAHHALPAHQTGKHGIETSPLERSNSTSSSMYHQSSVAPPYGAEPVPMALNGSTFGASSSLDDEYYQEKTAGGMSQHDGYGHHNAAYDLDGDYASYPPAVQPNHSNTGVNGAYEPDSDDETRGAGAGGAGIGAGAGAAAPHVTYPVYR